MRTVGGFLAAVCGAGALAAACPRAQAEIGFTPYLTAQNEFHTNLFAAAEDGSSGEEPAEENIRRGIAGFETTLAGGDQKLTATAEGRRLDFQIFDTLNHDEYKVGGNLDWKAIDSIGGTLSADQERRMASFANHRTTELTMETEQTGQAQVNLALTPAWRLELGGRGRHLKSPLTDFPEFGLRETGPTLGVKYNINPGTESENGNASNVTAGVVGEQIRGRFEGIGSAGYRLSTLQATSTYAPGGPSTLEAFLGYTVIQPDGDLNKVSGLTGSLRYRHDISALTGFQVRGYRRINSYIAGADATTDTGASAGIDWRPLINLSMGADYEWSRSLFNGLSRSGAVENGRRDQTQQVQGRIAYVLMNWLTLRGYALHRNRDSNFAAESYRETVAGVELTARWE